jgi:hypothetical protein
LVSFDDGLRQEEAEMSKDQDKITLRVDGTRKQLDTSVAEWPAEFYELDGASRGEAQCEKPDALDPDAVLELELANGTRILVAAADAESYLGSGRRAGRG